MDFIKNKRYLALAGLICLLLGTFLPIFVVSSTIISYSVSISLIKYWEGKVILALIVLNAMFIFKDYIKKYVPKMFESDFGRRIDGANQKMSLIPTVLSALMAIYLTSTLSGVENYSYVKYSYGIGFWLIWIGVVALIAHAILYTGGAKTTTGASATKEAVNTPIDINVNPNAYPNANVNASYGRPFQTATETPVQAAPTNPTVQPNIQTEVPPVMPMPATPVNNPVTPTPLNNTANADTDASIKYCPVCGNKVDANATSCYICGSKLQ